MILCYLNLGYLILRYDCLKITLQKYSNLFLPKTCTLQHYQKTGECSLVYTNLERLVDSNFKLYTTVRRCDSYPDSLPSFSLSCTGPLCSAIFSPSFCSADSDCPSGLQCINLADVNYLSTNNIPGPCTDTQSGIQWWRTVIQLLYNKQQDFKPELKVCFVDYKRISDGFNKWLNTVSSIEGDTTFVTGLEADEEVEPKLSPTSPESQQNNGNKLLHNFYEICLLVLFFCFLHF